MNTYEKIAIIGLLLSVSAIISAILYAEWRDRQEFLRRHKERQHNLAEKIKRSKRN
jgi:uncharacterized membrane protein